MAFPLDVSSVPDWLRCVGMQAEPEEAKLRKMEILSELERTFQEEGLDTRDLSRLRQLVQNGSL